MYPYKYIFPRYLQLYKYSQKCKIKTLICVFVVLSPTHHRDAVLPYCWVVGGQNTLMWAQRARGGIFKHSLFSPLTPYSPSAPFHAAAHWEVSLNVIGALAGARGEAVVQGITQGFQIVHVLPTWAIQGSCFFLSIFFPLSFNLVQTVLLFF